MEEFDVLMEKLREEYHDLGLTDSQIIRAKSIGLSPEGVVEAIKTCETAAVAFQVIWDRLVIVINGIVESDSFQELLKSVKSLESQFMECKIEQPPRNKKGKQLKPWEKKKFYQ